MTVLDQMIEMSSRESLGGAKISRYWLPLERPTLDSITIEGDDIWFYISDSLTDFSHRRGIGQIKLKDSKVEFSQYVLSESQMEKPEEIQKRLEAVRLGLLSHEEALRRALADKICRSIGQGIAAHDGHVWYGETEGIWLVRRTDNGALGRPAPKKQAFCKMNTETHRVTKYLFSAPDEDPSLDLDLFPFRLDLDPSGRRVWGTNQRIHVWVFDTATNKLKVLKVGKFAEQKMEETVASVPEHLLRGVAVEPNGKRGWLIDNKGALYLFNVEDESLLKYPLTGFRPKAVDLAPDGKIWCTSVALAGVPVRDLHPPYVEIGYILSLDPSINELAAYAVPQGFLSPDGIFVTDKGEVWFGFGDGRYSEGGLSKLNPEENKGLKMVITPEEEKAWELAEYDATETEGEEISPSTFEISPNQPIKREYRQEFQMYHYEGLLTYAIQRPNMTVRDLAQDSKGRIWFTTWGSGYVGVLTP